MTAASTAVALANEGVSTQAKPQVVKTQILYPKKQRVVVKQFEPWSQPTPAQVSKIIYYEGRRYGASGAKLHSVIGCESGGRWNASNGTHVGLGQFLGSTFRRGMAGFDTRKVRIVDRKRILRKARQVKTYSDGSKSVTVLKRKRAVKLIVIRKGEIPRNPPTTHGWSQIRIMAMAFSGKGTTSPSEWVCQ